jgi:hypothetical protein
MEALQPLLERISGPYHGYYVAAYAIASDDGILGFAKVCAGPVADVWSCEAISKVGCGISSSSENAVDEVEIRARDAIRFLRQYSDF